MRKFRCMTDLESDFFLTLKFSPWIFRDEIETLHINHLAILRFRVVAVGDINDISLNVFLDNEPRAAT